MKKADQIVDVYYIFVTVEAEGIKCGKLKHKTKFTGQNYIGLPITPEDRKKGYNIGWGNSRLGKDEILKVSRRLFGDNSTEISRHVYFLEGQEQQALELIRIEVDKAITSMYENTCKLYDTWVNRSTNPNKPPTLEGVVMASKQVTFRMMNVENKLVGISLSELNSPLDMRRISLEIPEVSALKEMQNFLGQQIKRMSSQS